MNFLKKMLLSLFLFMPLEGCADGALAGAIKLDKAKVWLEKVHFKVAKNVNGNAPVAVHLVIVYDDGVLGEISKMTADQYFTAEPQLRKDHSSDIDFFTWEVVPGQEMDDEDISLTQAYGKGGFVFARYSTPDAHREAIADEEVITLHLDEKDFYITKN
jgi:type VI secretion system protein